MERHIQIMGEDMAHVANTLPEHLLIRQLINRFDSGYKSIKFEYYHLTLT
jgi:hypothetical protein